MNKISKKVLKYLIGQEFLSDKEPWERVDKQKLIITAEFLGLKKLAKKMKTHEIDN